MKMREMLAWLARLISPGYGTCLSCGMPWSFTKYHVTDYSVGGGCFSLCESCWSRFTPKERMPYYMQLMDMWGKRPGDPVREAVAQAVEDGK